MDLKKQQVKAISFVIIFLMGILGSIISQPAKAYAAANNASTLGIVNYQLLIAQHPDTAKAQETMQAALTQAQSDFDAKSANMNDNEKQAYYQQLQQGLDQKRQEFMKDISDKIIAAVKAVADAKGLTIVVDKSITVYGGQDITDEVLKQITGK